MATTPSSPPSNTSPSSAVSPAIPPPPSPPPSSAASSPPQSSSSPPSDQPTTPPTPQSSASPPDPATPSPPPQSPPPSTSSSPPPQPPPPTSNSTSPPPSPMSASPPVNPPPPTTSSSNPPQTSPPPPPSPSTPPPRSSPSPPLAAAQPTQSSPPPPSPTPPASRSPPPPSRSPPQPSAPPSENSPPPPTSATPPQNSTRPPPSAQPPETSPPPPPTSPTPPRNSTRPPPSAQPPETSPPPPPPPPTPLSQPPSHSPPPPASAAPPKTSPPPPPSSAAPTPKNAPPPPRIASRNPPASPPTTPPSNSTPNASAPSSPVIRLAPPPPSSLFPPSSVNSTIPSASENSKPAAGNGGIGTGGIVAILVGLSVVMLSLVGLGVWCLRKRRKEVSGLNGVYVMPSPLGSSTSPRSGKFTDSTFTKTQSTALLMGSGSSSEFALTPSEPGGLGHSRSWFTYEELVKATNGFSSQSLLGEGGFGSVYYGCLPDGREVAVKQLNAGGGQGEREFKAEVEIISRIHHRHLVSLVGYCITENRRLLIYDYVPNNTLHFHLHGEGGPILDWPTRVKIAAGAARGIAYLHEDCHPRIIHRDIKSSNILLDNNFEAKVSDFGLAKLALDANTHITTRVMGTFGYVAPEYASSGKLTEKSDVFSYGVVLLELITGRKPVDPLQPMGDESLVEWARPLLSHALDSDNFDGLVDPRLGTNYIESEMFRMIEAAAACVRHSAAKRPRMGQVVRAFDNLATADLTNGMRVGESEVFNSAQQSAEIRLFQRMAFGSQNHSTDFFSQGSSDSQRLNGKYQ